MKQLMCLFSRGFCFSLPLSAQPVFINEIHYEDINADEGEFVEVAGPAGTDVTNWKIIFYDGGTGSTYATVTLAGQLPNTCGGLGVVAIDKSGIENGNPDGIALVDNSGGGDLVVQFLSYGGAFSATNGPANGSLSADIGVQEDNGTAVGHSLQLSGSGENYSDFAWNGPAVNTKGTCNTGQIFTGTTLPSVTLSVDVAQIAEDSGVAQFTATLSEFSPTDVTVNLTFSGNATRFEDYAAGWRRHPVLPGNFDWSINGDIVVMNPSASPSRRSGDGLPLPSTKDVSLPDVFSLSQNYPNPFNPSTTISYSLPLASNVRLEVFDLLGKHIRRVDSGLKTSGDHEVRIDSFGLATGVYYYRLSVAGFSQTRRMVVLR